MEALPIVPPARLCIAQTRGPSCSMQNAVKFCKTWLVSVVLIPIFANEAASSSYTILPSVFHANSLFIAPHDWKQNVAQKNAVVFLLLTFDKCPQIVMILYENVAPLRTELDILVPRSPYSQEF